MYDLIGVGFGPANLALAIAIDDHNRHCPDEERIEALFLERSQHFAWHPGMLLPHTTMQISFLKDLATLRHVELERPADAPLARDSGADAAQALGMKRLAERLRS